MCSVLQSAADVKPFEENCAFKETEHPVRSKDSYERIPLFTAMITYIGFYFLLILGYIHLFLFPSNAAQEKYGEGYVPLYTLFEKFYKHGYRRMRDIWNIPICSVPGVEVVLKNRITKDHGKTFEYTGTQKRCLNLGSYNYLGFAEATGPCAEAAIEAIREYGLATCSSTQELGTHPLIVELEKTTATFLGVDDAVVCGMGFATNSLNIPPIISTGCLVLSDEKNHASLILGLRLSGATCRVFKHNDPKDLERKLIEAIIAGQPKTKLPWRKILIVVEGVFSMEGTVVDLPEVIRIKKKYKAYLYLDEAHSVGAMGEHGRGVVDHFGCDPRDVDILMGTFTKSFGSAGGYIAGSGSLIAHLRAHSAAACYASTMSPPVAQQVITSMRIIMGLDGGGEGASRIGLLARNTRYFRRRLHQIGVVVYGNEDSPVVPMLVYSLSKMQ